ncbi:MAG TPA: type II toxin-antitoxin system ParD family antitoxin [Tepidisphaeraceae bacterium]|jgi:antitoxin ParD1/3/4|nr:type II toxin-antitoxin system ParD family antitoxin [Tepidisphaeraceae bacterium]
MNVRIHPHLVEFIEEQIRKGRYASPDDVVNSALQHLSTHIEFPPEDIEDLKRELEIGLEELDRGQTVPWDPEELWSEVERLHAERAKVDGKKAG